MPCFGGDDDSIYDGTEGPSQRVPEAVHAANAEKLHTYNMYRALKKGHMPSTAQILEYLEAIQRSDVLTDEEGLSQDGRVLLRLFRRWLSQASVTIGKKNNKDQLQDFIWYARHADMSGGRRAMTAATGAKKRADTKAAVESSRTVISMILGNSDFRELIADLATFAREVLGDTKKAIREEANDANEELLDLDNGRIKNTGKPHGYASSSGSSTYSHSDFDPDHRFDDANAEPSKDPDHPAVHYDGRPISQKKKTQSHEGFHHPDSYPDPEAAFLDERQAAAELDKHPDCPGCREELQMAQAHAQQNLGHNRERSSWSSGSTQGVPSIEITAPPEDQRADNTNSISDKSRSRKQKKAHKAAQLAESNNHDIPPHVQHQLDQPSQPHDAQLPNPIAEHPEGSLAQGVTENDVVAAKDSAHPVAPAPPEEPGAQDEYWEVAENEQQKLREQQEQQLYQQQEPEQPHGQAQQTQDQQAQGQQTQGQQAQRELRDIQSQGQEKLRQAGLQSQRFVRKAKSKVADTAASVSTATDPSTVPSSQLRKPFGSKDPNAAADIAAQHTVRAGKKAKEAAVKRAHGETGKALRTRIQRLIMSLRQQNTYDSAAHTISHLLRQYLQVYGRAVDEAVDSVDHHVETNDEMQLAFKALWSFISGLGDSRKWAKAEREFDKAVRIGSDETSLELIAVHISDMVEDMLTKPEFFDHPEQRFEELKQETTNMAPGLGDAMLEMLAAIGEAFSSISDDPELEGLNKTSSQIVDLVFPEGQGFNSSLLSDIANSAVPLIFSTIQYIPIPRLEISTPQIDLLLENLILEPGRSVGGSSFFPHDIAIDNILSLRMAKRSRRALTRTMGGITIVARGVCMKADNVGYWLHAHKGLAQFHDQGLASFAVDGTGMDVVIDADVYNDNAEMLAIRRISVIVHELTYKLRASKFSCIASLLKPLLRPILKATLETQIEKLIRDNMADLNLELVFARERLRAARAAKAKNPGTFVRAVCARRHRNRYDVHTRVGVDQPGKGVFKGRYAPGSLAREWHADQVRNRTEENEYGADGWRTDLFSRGTRGQASMAGNRWR